MRGENAAVARNHAVFQKNGCPCPIRKLGGYAVTISFRRRLPADFLDSFFGHFEAFQTSAIKVFTSNGEHDAASRALEEPDIKGSFERAKSSG